jgi:hypothetical protein
VVHVFDEYERLIADPASATLEAESDEAANRLYCAAFAEVSRLLPELRPALLETQAGRRALYLAVRGGGDQGSSYYLRHPAALRLITALKEVAAQLPLLDLGAGPPPETRLAFDDATLTVALDGTRHRVEDPRAYAVYKAIAKRDAPTITKIGIQAKVRGVKGQKTIPGLIDALPPALRQTVNRDTTGYWIVLP